MFIDLYGALRLLIELIGMAGRQKTKLTTTWTIQLAPNMLDELKERRERTGAPIAEIIRRAIAAYLTGA